MINNVVLVGRLTKTPELRYTSANIAVCQFSIAVNRTFQNQSGQTEADFINCVAWRTTAENLCKFMQKGSLVGVEGRIQSRTYDEPNGTRRYITEVVCDNLRFLESRQNNNSQSNNSYQNSGSNNQYNSTKNPFENQKTYEEPIKSDDFNPFKTSIDIDLNDDLPF